MKTKFFSVFIIAILLLGLTLNKTYGQTTYKETMGTVTGTTSIASHTGWTYYGILNYSGTADVRATTPSNVTDYSQASGGANVFITNTVGREFVIAGINTNTFTNFDKISFGFYKSTTASDGSELILEYTTDNGSSWTTITKPSLPTGTGTAKWHYITSSTVTFPTDTNLTIRFRQTSTSPQFRIDDVTLVGDGALPVELSYFNASVSNRQPQLRWGTISEINNSRFEIKRQEKESWIKVGEVPGHGTSNQPHDYVFTDSKLNTGTYKYKLVQIDYNGNYEDYLLNQDIVIGNPHSFDLDQNYPNPFNPTTNITFSLPEKEYVILRVYDMLGREVRQLFNGWMEPGYYTQSFNVDGLASGMYFYSLSNGTTKTIVKKMTIVK